MAAVVAGRDVPAQSRRATLLDRGHDLELAEAETAGVGLTIGVAQGMEDVRKPERGPTHRATSGDGGPRKSAGETQILRDRGTSLRQKSLLPACATARGLVQWPDPAAARGAKIGGSTLRTCRDRFDRASLALQRQVPTGHRPWPRRLAAAGR
jgi:hypothetical protein